MEFLGHGDEVTELPQVERRALVQTHARRVSPPLEEVLRTGEPAVMVVVRPDPGEKR
jgi:hypothetical protein